jgi:hypothetical protein
MFMGILEVLHTEVKLELILLWANLVPFARSLSCADIIFTVENLFVFDSWGS